MNNTGSKGFKFLNNNNLNINFYILSYFNDKTIHQSAIIDCFAWRKLPELILLPGIRTRDTQATNSNLSHISLIMKFDNYRWNVDEAVSNWHLPDDDSWSYNTTTIVTVSDNVTLALPSSEEWRFYEEKWFIILIAVPCIGILLLFAFLFVICYCKCRRRRIPYSKEDGSESSPSSVINHGSTLSTNGLVYQVPIDFQEYASPAFSDDWSSERSSIGSSPAKNSPGKPEELQPWMYLEGGGDRDANPPVSPASSGGSLTVAEVIGSNKSKGQTAEPLHKWNDNSDRIHIPDVTMPGVDEEEDDAGLQNFVVGFTGFAPGLEGPNLSAIKTCFISNFKVLTQYL